LEYVAGFGHPTSMSKAMAKVVFGARVSNRDGRNRNYEQQKVTMIY
jgi:hypothetical protein